MQKIDNIIYNLKKEYDDVFYIQIEGENFIFRPLTRFEYEEILVNRDLREDVMSEVVCEIATLYPEEYNFSTPHMAGIPEALSNQIIYYSAFEDPDYIDQVLAEKREDMNENVFTMMENVIAVAFPNIDIEEIKNMNAYKIIDYYARASWIIRNMYANVKIPDQIPGENPNAQHQQKQVNPAQMQHTPQNHMQFQDSSEVDRLHKMSMNKRTMGDNLDSNFQ